MIRRAAPLSFLLCLAGCATRITGGFNGDDGGDQRDLSHLPDLAKPIDLARGSDLTPGGKSCGEIVRCAIGCGFTPGQCQVACLQGASPMGLQEAGALLVCGFQNCAGGLTGDGGTGNVLGCLITSCGNEVAGCEGLF